MTGGLTWPQNLRTLDADPLTDRGQWGMIEKPPSEVHSLTLPLMTVIRLGMWCLISEIALVLCGWLVLWVGTSNWGYVADGVLVAYVLVAFFGGYGRKRKFMALLNLSCLLVLIGLSTWIWSLFLNP